MLEEAGLDPIPNRIAHNSVSPDCHCCTGESSKLEGSGFPGELLRQSREVPFFLWRSLDSLSGLVSPSLRDFFWIGGQQTILHPHLANALLVMVNRRRKRPVYSASKPMWQQSLYVIRKRDGTYLCGCCGLDDKTLIIHPYSEHFHSSERLRNRQDAEVVGQIVTVARRLL